MLPIPVPIIVSNKRLLIPLIYLVITSSICYLFLIALVEFRSFDHNITSKRSTLAQSLQANSEITFASQAPTVTALFGEKDQSKKFSKREVLVRFEDSEKSEVRKQAVVENVSWKGKKRKESKSERVLSLPSATTSNNSKSNGTRRSNSTKIWEGHQDRLPLLVDETSPSRQLWPDDASCNTFRVHFAKKDTFKSRALVSFPGSGNSWLRYLIECSTGLFTGSVFHDKGLFLSGLLGEMRLPNDGSTIVQKTHHDTLYRSSYRTRQAYVKLTELMFGYRGILVIRNPYDALISYWTYIHTKDHKGPVEQSNFFGSDWTKFVLDSTTRWTSLIKSWVENSQSLLIIEYEKLKKNPHPELLRILDYLNQPVNQSRLHCLMKPEHVEGPFHRSKINSCNDSITYRKYQHENFPLIQLPYGQKNSKFWAKSDSDSQFLVRESEVDRQNSSNNHFNYYEPTLDLIVQDNIRKINRLFQEKEIPIVLSFSGPSHFC